MRVYCGLIHYPVYNKNKEVIATSITTSNIHDIARTARTFCLKAFFIITPVSRQQALIRTIIRHWKSGYGATYNPTRGIALDVIRICPSLDECLKGIEEEDGERPRIVVTCARPAPEVTGFEHLRQRMSTGSDAWLILFGTGWGLTREVLDMADVVVEPIRGPGDYNHLSVRAAVAITLDRLLGVRVASVG
ncbi:MAG: RNA methyltransferase [bacterium]